MSCAEVRVALHKKKKTLEKKGSTECTFVVSDFQQACTFEEAKITRK